MTHANRARILLTLLMFGGGLVWLPGLDWGLPSRTVDGYLFGDRSPWSGREILALAPPHADRDLGSDVDVNPIAQRDHPVILNATDAQRAEIVRRYRLFSYQPDEMITFDALAGMNPSKFQLDPKLYQYGGLWIYPVGALLKIGSLLGYIQLHGDLARYLDEPESIGRFYVVARLYAAAWGLAGIWAVFWVVRRITASLVAATAGAACFVCLPVVVNMAHEAKPHLPGAVLMLLAIVAAMKYVDRGATRWWLLAGALCGAAAGMVLSATVIFVIIPVMALLRADTWQRRLRVMLGAGAVGVAGYSLTNPYVPINLFVNRDVIRSNFANTAGMYEVGRIGEGAVNAARLIVEGASLGLTIAAVVGMVFLLIRAARRRQVHPLAWLIAAPAGVIVVQFIALAAGKPGEYGRFALFVDVALVIAGAVALARVSGRTVDRVVMSCLLVALTAVPSWFYLMGFVRDARAATRRTDDAYWLSMLHRAGARTLAVCAEPAPYSLPPVDLFAWRLVLLPRRFDLAKDSTDADVIVRAVDDLGPNGATVNGFIRQSIVVQSDVFPTRISWADKPFEVWVRPGLIERLQSGATSRPASR